MRCRVGAKISRLARRRLRRPAGRNAPRTGRSGAAAAAPPTGLRPSLSPCAPLVTARGTSRTARPTSEFRSTWTPPPSRLPPAASVHGADPSPAPLGGCVCVRGSFALLSRPDSCVAPGSKVKGDPRPPCALALLVEVARDGHLAVLLLHPQTA